MSLLDQVDPLDNQISISKLNELDDWKKKYRILSRERTMLDQALQAQRELTKMYQEQLVEIITKK